MINPRPWARSFCLVAGAFIATDTCPVLAAEASYAIVGGVSAFQAQYENLGIRPSSKKSSGELSVVTGVALASDSSELTLEDIRAYTRRATNHRDVCVRFATGDGLYYAEVPYQGSGPYNAPPRLPLPTRYGDTLKGYAPSEFLTRAVVGNCDGLYAPNRQFIPVRIGGNGNAEALVVYLNILGGATTRVSATLGLPGNRSVKGLCNKPGTPRAMYTRVCRFPFKPDLLGVDAALTVRVRDLMSPSASRSERHQVLLSNFGQ